MNTLRWLLLLPAALLASLAAGAMATILSDLIGLPAWMVYCSSGLLWAFAFIFVGYQVSPSKVKLSVVLLTLIAIGVSVGFFVYVMLIDQQQIKAFASVGVIVGSWLMFRSLSEKT